MRLCPRAGRSPAAPSSPCTVRTSAEVQSLSTASRSFLSLVPRMRSGCRCRRTTTASSCCRCATDLHGSEYRVPLHSAAPRRVAVGIHHHRGRDRNVHARHRIGARCHGQRRHAHLSRRQSLSRRHRRQSRLSHSERRNDRGLRRQRTGRFGRRRRPGHRRARRLSARRGLRRQRQRLHRRRPLRAPARRSVRRHHHRCGRRHVRILRRRQPDQECAHRQSDVDCGG